MSSADRPTPHCDVLVVGARISGAALAIRLALAGRSVALVDRAGFPSDTLSTHLIQVTGVQLLQELGVLDRMKATGARFLDHMSVVYDRIQLSTDVEAGPGSPPGGMSVSRDLLDQFLIDRAVEVGVDVRLKTSLVDLDRDAAGRVSAARLRGPDGPELLHTDLVVGADGRGSKVATLVGARTYNTTVNERFTYWADFAGVAPDTPPGHHYRDGEDITIAFWTDGGRFTVMIAPDLPGFADFKRDVGASFDAAVARCEPLRPALAGAKRVSRPIGTAFFPGYFRESAGPGWALIGDAGHFKDPTLGQGISDALRQTDRLARQLAAVDLADHTAVDRVTRRWWAWRDRDAMPMYWFGHDFAKGGPLGVLERELLRAIAARPRVRQKFVDGVLSHRVSPYQVITPRLLLTSARSAVRNGEWTVGEAVGTVGRRLLVELGRFRMLVRPRYGPLPRPTAGATGGETVGRTSWASAEPADRPTARVRAREE